LAHIYQKVNTLEKHALIGDGNCVALVQKLSDVGHTSSWKPGERVLDSKNILPGKVIATFENGRYPNRHTGDHAAFYLDSGPKSMKTGKPACIVMMGQWVEKVTSLPAASCRRREHCRSGCITTIRTTPPCFTSSNEDDRPTTDGHARRSR
jgi:hypothetical protein